VSREREVKRRGGLMQRAVRWIDDRSGSASAIRKVLGYVFPDHWTFLLGEIALYSFVVLVGTGIFLTFFFEPSTAHVTYQGSYAPLQGVSVSKAFDSTMNLSFDVKGGLLMRQTHHWAALVFVAAITLHLMRIFFTGAFRKPRDVNYYVGLTMLMLVIVEGYAGYSLLDDLLSGMGLAIGNGVALSLPIFGADVSNLIWGGQFPGTDAFASRLFIAHVLILPILIATLLTIHLILVARPHHTQFAGQGKTERNAVGSPLWPTYTLRSIGLFLAVGAVLFALGGLVQINPIWQWGPYDPYRSTNAAQPDWYLGWLIGALRLMPPLEIHAFGWTLVPNPFFGGALFPLMLFAFLYGWPALERRITGDRRLHNLLDRPRDNPLRTAVGSAVLTFTLIVFLAGSSDRVFLQFGIPYEGQVVALRIAVLVLPAIVFFVVKRTCEDLRRTEAHPLRDFPGRVVRRTPGGGYEPEP
jgi:ubiquinol-cytochrome c reductase cytochrome b subunit